MDLRHKRTIFRLADTAITLLSIFLLLDAMFGFTRPRDPRPAQPRIVTANDAFANLSASCIGGFSNQRTAGGVTQVAPRGTPFNAYQLTFTNTGSSSVTIYGATVDLAGQGGTVFAEPQDTGLGRGHGLTLRAGHSRQVVETAGATHPVTSCRILSWQS